METVSRPPTSAPPLSGWLGATRAAPGQSLHQKAALSAPTPTPCHAGNKVSAEEKDRAETRQCWGLLEQAPHPPTLSSLANTQESGCPSTPKVSAFPPPPPASAHRQGFGRWPGRQARAGMQGSAVWRCRRHKAEGLFPRSVHGGRGARPAAQASYFFPVRWMCWKRVMEKAMPRI